MAAAWSGRARLDDDGVLHLEGIDGADPVCPECGTPIRLRLDLATFVVGRDHRLVHARCVWRPQVFYAEAERADAALAPEERESTRLG